MKELAVSIRIWLMKVKSGVLLLEQFDIFRGGDGEDAAYRFTANFDEKTGKFRVISKKRSIEGEGDCRVGIHLINNAVMLSETKHLWSTPLGIGPRLIRDSSLRSE